MGNIMCSIVGAKDVVTLDLGVNKRGDPVYRISWFRDGKWTSARYDSVKEAYDTLKMIEKMI